MSVMQSKNMLDAAGLPTPMAVRTPTDGVNRPVHHSEVVALQREVTRPANTTAYIAGDAIGAAGDVKFQFDIKAAGIPSGLIVAARLIRDQTSNASVRFRAIVNDALPASLPAADNDPAPLVYANRASRRGWIDFANPISGAAAGSNCLEYAGVLSNPQGVPVDPADGVLTLVLSTLDGFAAVSGEKFVIELDLVV
ncbi:hypothetical protein CA606_18255 [Caulobacter vibrioides]|uniref:Uncharacterized protein n=1 Tax=Caulobacter vibrioides TaxID=155892 RepID=A0A290MPY4_CAUVI|nr:hypothetical protein [Caulobacter vibrioides]ATC34117.1 hypothetical protein CA606_18255 [Caulobacter vibrioides]